MRQIPEGAWMVIADGSGGNAEEFDDGLNP
jgi:hypothetical protein